MVAGAVAGGVALLVFVGIHAVWIVPIWPMLMMLPIAALVGALAAWPFEAMSARAALPPAPIDGIAFSLVLLATLIPTAVFGVLAGPVDRDRITVPAVVIPLALAFPAGAAIGLLLTGSAAAAGALAGGALALALTLGHNLPFFPIGSPGWEKAFSLVVLVELAAGIAFSVTRAVTTFGPMEGIAR